MDDLNQLRDRERTLHVEARKDRSFEWLAIMVIGLSIFTIVAMWFVDWQDRIPQ